MSEHYNKSAFDRSVDIALYSLLALFGLVTLFPLYFVVVMSITPYQEIVSKGGFVLFPASVTLESYRFIFNSEVIPRALGVSAAVTVVGTLLNLIFTTLLGYGLSKKQLPGRSAILLGILFTMLFSAGIIPLYLVVRMLGLLDSLGALILPALVSAFNLLIMKSYFENLPEELEEAAKVDGCGDFRTLLQIILPLATPIIATLGLFYGVNHWNNYFSAIMFLTDKDLYPLQVILRNMIRSADVSTELAISNPAAIRLLPPATIKMATVVVAILPVILVYPFLQKYFVKGMLLGSIKG